jgi:predicted PurR-regulated permease PerM
MEVEGEM